MTRVVLVRHGQTMWNLEAKFQGHSDIELSPLGRRQAELVSDRLIKENIKTVYASDLSRAFFTAQKIADKHALQVIAVPELREIKFGEWEGLTYRDIEERWPGLYDRFLTRSDETNIPGGETFCELKERAYKALERLIEQHDAETIVVVSHGGTLCTILATVLNMHLNDVWRIRLDNTSVSIIEYYNKRPVVTLINDTRHLEI